MYLKLVSKGRRNICVITLLSTYFYILNSSFNAFSWFCPCLVTILSLCIYVRSVFPTEIGIQKFAKLLCSIKYKSRLSCKHCVLGTKVHFINNHQISAFWHFVLTILNIFIRMCSVQFFMQIWEKILPLNYPMFDKQCEP